MSERQPQPFVVQPPGPDAANVARTAARTWGLPEPELMRVGMNALYTAGPSVVLRVSRTTAPPERAPQRATRLAAIGVRVPTFVRPQPLVVGDLAVFALERLTPVGHIDWADVGRMVRRLHETEPVSITGVGELPPCETFPWWQVRAALDDVRDLVDRAALDGLEAAIDTHGDWAERVTDRVVCHGDVHPGNVLPTVDGPVLLDWDLLCTGPPAWDHAPLLTWTERWGGERGVYEHFADGYGRSFRGDPLAESIAVVRNVSATLMRLRAGRADPSAATEAARRLAYWRGDLDAAPWQAQ